VYSFFTVRTVSFPEIVLCRRYMRHGVVAALYSKTSRCDPHRITPTLSFLRGVMYMASYSNYPYDFEYIYRFSLNSFYLGVRLTSYI